MDRIPWLTIATFLPALAGAGVLALPKERARTVALAGSLAVLLLAGGLAFTFTDSGAFQFVEHVSWIGPGSISAVPDLNIRYSMGMDGIALVMVLLTALLTPLCILGSWTSVQERVKGFFAALLFLEAGMIGVFLARDLFLFYIFWEVMLIPMVLMIGIWGGPRRVYASVKFMVYTMAGSLLMFVAILYCYFASHGNFSIAEMPKALAGLPFGTECLLFAAFAIAFAIKVPVFPFHTWLPDAHVEAPTAGSVILAGVLLKMGAYGFIRFAVPFFPNAAAHYAPFMMALAVIGIVFGALMSMAQTDIKKLIAYSSVSHLGFVVLGIFSFTEAGMQGAILQMVNHGLSTGALFLLVGMIYERTHKRGTDDFGGLAQPMPLYAAAFMIVTLSSIGLPGLNGFVGEFLVLKGAFDARKWAAIGAAFGVILGAVYMLKLYRDVFWGPASEKHGHLSDLNKVEKIALAPLIVLIFVLGFFPGPFLKWTAPAAKNVLNHVKGATHVQP